MFSLHVFNLILSYHILHSICLSQLITGIVYPAHIMLRLIQLYLIFVLLFYYYFAQFTYFFFMFFFILFSY